MAALISVRIQTCATVNVHVHAAGAYFVRLATRYLSSALLTEHRLIVVVLFVCDALGLLLTSQRILVHDLVEDLLAQGALVLTLRAPSIDAVEAELVRARIDLCLLLLIYLFYANSA